MPITALKAASWICPLLLLCGSAAAQQAPPVSQKARLAVPPPAAGKAALVRTRGKVPTQKLAPPPWERPAPAEIAGLRGQRVESGEKLYFYW